jgi:hypothetical protein
MARGNLEETQKIIKKQINKHRREPDFIPGDLIWVTTKNWKIERSSRKLNYQMTGLYGTLNIINNSYKVKFLETIKIHPVFSPDRFRKAANNFLPQQKNDSPLPI